MPKKIQPPSPAPVHAKNDHQSAHNLKQRLSPLAYRVTQQAGTEPAFSGRYQHPKKTGHYRCICCNQILFSSHTQFDSGSGWPSFWDSINEQAIDTHMDSRHGLVRTEVICSGCKAHLGHVFDDGPYPTGLRYCINSVALKHQEDMLD